MKKIDTNYDDILKVNYSLYSIKLSELKTMANSWYDNLILNSFDTRAHNKFNDNQHLLEMKLSGVVSNYFYAYQENGKYYLLDGYNRLFTDYGELKNDPIVYIKVITDKCPEHILMSIMFRLNMWKLQNSRPGKMKTHDFLDRGFRLFIHKKFNIEINNGGEYNAKTRYRSDFGLLDFYFINEKKIACYWSHNFTSMAKLFSHKNVVNDIREMMSINNYVEQPFTNYQTFVNGYVMFLSWRRVSGDERTYDFNDYLEILKKDKFYKKLIKMRGTDSTRINVYNFFRRVHEDSAV